MVSNAILSVCEREISFFTRRAVIRDQHWKPKSSKLLRRVVFFWRKSEKQWCSAFVYERLSSNVRSVAFLVGEEEGRILTGTKHAVGNFIPLQTSNRAPHIRALKAH